MGIVSSVLRVLSDFGDAAGWLIAALVLFAYGRRIIQENEKAHAAITENVKENRRQIAALDAKIDGVAQALGAKIDAIAKDVSFLAGRRAERDRATGVATAETQE